jgi:hypothetical protein
LDRRDILKRKSLCECRLRLSAAHATHERHDALVRNVVGSPVFRVWAGNLQQEPHLAPATAYIRPMRVAKLSILPSAADDVIVVVDEYER